MPKYRNSENKLTSEQIYNHSAIRYTAIVFGALFSQIKVRKYTKDGSIDTSKERSVTLAYSAKDAYALWIEQQMRTPQGNVEINNIFPRMSFELVGLQLAQQRGTNTNLPIYSQTASNGKTYGSLSPVAYAFDYNLSIWCKHMDDSIQILDQILPIFTPSINLKIKENKQIGIVNDITVTLNSVSKSDNYDSQFDTQRLVQWDLSFTVYADFIPITTVSDNNTIISNVIVDAVSRTANDYLNGKEPEYMTNHPDGDNGVDNNPSPDRFQPTTEDKFGRTHSAKINPELYYNGTGIGMYGEIVIEEPEEGKSVARGKWR